MVYLQADIERKKRSSHSKAVTILVTNQSIELLSVDEMRKRRPNESPEAMPGQRPPLPQSSSSGAPRLWTLAPKVRLAFVLAMCIVSPR